MEDIQLIIRRLKRSGEPRLNLTGKQMISIPPEIYQLKLAHLDLSYNKITSIEPKILQLATLEELDLSNNCIEEIPEEFLNMPNLQSLNLSNNPLITKFQILNGHFHQPQLNQILQKLFQISPGSNQQQKQVQQILPDRPKTQSRAIRQQQELYSIQYYKTHSIIQQFYCYWIYIENYKISIQQLQHTNHVLEVDSNEFEVNEIISQGGFSIVHRGYFRGTEIAIKKIFNPNITQQLLDEINNEIEMLSLLRHPNIVLLMACCIVQQNISMILNLLYEIDQQLFIKVIYNIYSFLQNCQNIFNQKKSILQQLKYN